MVKPRTSPPSSSGEAGFERLLRRAGREAERLLTSASRALLGGRQRSRAIPPVSTRGARRRQPPPPPPRHPGEAARLAATYSLPAFARALADGGRQERLRAARLLGDLPEPHKTRLLCALLLDSDPRIREACAVTAASSGATGAVSALILALNDDDANVRMSSALAIEEICGRSIPFDRLETVSARHAMIDDLLSWWRKERLSELARAGTGEHR